jgi:hypothetical protein
MRISILPMSGAWLSYLLKLLKRLDAFVLKKRVNP